MESTGTNEYNHQWGQTHLTGLALGTGRQASISSQPGGAQFYKVNNSSIRYRGNYRYCWRCLHHLFIHIVATDSRQLINALCTLLTTQLPIIHTPTNTVICMSVTVYHITRHSKPPHHSKYHTEYHSTLFTTHHHNIITQIIPRTTVRWCYDRY